MFIETLRNMPIGLYFGKLDTNGIVDWTGRIVCESNEKRLVIEDLHKVTNIDCLDNKITKIDIYNEEDLRKMGLNLSDIERLGKKDYTLAKDTIVCKKTINLPVKTLFKYEGSDDEIEVVFVDRVKKLWNNSNNCEEQELSHVRISITNYDKMKLYGYSRKALEYICGSINTLHVATFGNIYTECKLYGNYKELKIKDLDIEDRVEIAEDILKNKKLKYDETYDRFLWKEENPRYMYSNPCARIMVVGRKKPWTIARDNSGFEYIKYFHDYDESLGYINDIRK